MGCGIWYIVVYSMWNILHSDTVMWTLVHGLRCRPGLRNSRLRNVVPKTCFFMSYCFCHVTPKTFMPFLIFHVGPTEGRDFGRTTHQNCDLAADITKQSKLKPISKTESTIWPHTSKFLGYLKCTTLRGAQTSNPYIINQ